MQKIGRLPNEDENRYIYRVCKQKDLIGTWSDVADLLNAELGHNYDESAYRKKFAYFESMFDSNMDELVGDESAEKVRILKDDLRTERYKLQALNLSQNREARQNSRFELFYEQIGDYVKSFDSKPLLKSLPEKDKLANQFVLAIADIHYGAKFDSETNAYSREEAELRFEFLLNEVTDYLMDRGISDLTVVGLGDAVQGILRYTDLKLNEAPVVQCVVEVAYLIARFLEGLSNVCRVTYYHVPSANHTQTRPLGSKASELASEDMERVIFAIVQEALKNNKRVTCYSNFSSDRISFTVAGYNCVAMHGHTVKNVEKLISELSNKDRVLYDYAFIGHYHKIAELTVGEGLTHNVEVLACPSIVGTDPYADSLLAGSKAAAKLFEFDLGHGHVGDHLFILN